jgi:hypothetical protein
VDNLLAVVVGALIAIVGGIAYRMYEATQQRRHWFRDHLREAAEGFLTDAQRFLDVVWEKLVGDLPDASEAIRPSIAAIEVDLSRVRLVAPPAVAESAADALKKLRIAFDKAQHARHPLDIDRWNAASAAAKEASDSLTDFAARVRRHLDS